MHLWALTHQSQGKEEDTQVVQEARALQSKKVKLVETKSSPASPTRKDSLLMKWDSPLGMLGSRSFLTKMAKVRKKVPKKLTGL